MTKTPLFVMHHERCECGHCRCVHAGGYTYCTTCATCKRYTWPGPGSNMPANHPRKKRVTR